MSYAHQFNERVTSVNKISDEQWNLMFSLTEGTNNSLLGYDNGGLATDVTIGAGLTLSGNILSAGTGSVGDVFGGSSSLIQTPAIYTDTGGKHIGQPTVSATTNTLLGYNGSSMTNIHASTGITISGGLISVTAGIGEGDVLGENSSVIQTPAIYTDTDGKHIGQATITPTANTLIGYNGAGDTMSLITAGTNINITDGVISAVNDGSGFVEGPVSSTNSGVALFSGTSGLLLKELPTPSHNSLLGFDNSGVTANVTIGTNLQLVSNVLTATGGGTGDVSFSRNFSEDITGAIPVYADNTGLVITNPFVSNIPNTVVGYSFDTGGLINYTAGSGIVMLNNTVSLSTGYTYHSLTYSIAPGTVSADIGNSVKGYQYVRLMQPTYICGIGAVPLGINPDAPNAYNITCNTSGQFVIIFTSTLGSTSGGTMYLDWAEA